MWSGDDSRFEIRFLLETAARLVVQNTSIFPTSRIPVLTEHGLDLVTTICRSIWAGRLFG